MNQLFQEAGLQDALYENVLELCKIDGVMYGAALDFTVYTVLVKGDAAPGEWNYEQFLRTLENGNYKAVFPAEYGRDSKGLFLNEFFMNGLGDNYLIDADNPQNCIDKEKLNKILDLAEEFCPEEEQREDPAWMFQKGEILCECDALRDVTKITELRKTWGEDIAFVGFPTRQGGKHLVTAVIPLAIRADASAEEKKVAAAFLLEALSYEGQIAEMEGNYNFGITVRKDAFEEQIKKCKGNYVKLARMSGIPETSMEGIRAGLEEDAEVFRSLVRDAAPVRRLPQEVDDILTEEGAAYFGGVISRELYLDHLQNRIRLYLLED